MEARCYAVAQTLLSVQFSSCHNSCNRVELFMMFAIRRLHLRVCCRMAFFVGAKIGKNFVDYAAYSKPLFFLLLVSL